MNSGGIVLLERDHDLLCERQHVGDSRQWNDTVKLSLIGNQGWPMFNLAMDTGFSPRLSPQGR